MSLFLELNKACYWKQISASPVTTADLKTTTLFARTRSVLCCARVSLVNIWWQQFVCGQRRRLTLQSMLISLGAPGGLWVTKCWDVCMCFASPYAVWRMCTHTQKVTAILFTSTPPVHPYAICGSAYVPLKGRIMWWKGIVIGSSTVLYNTAMASWIRNWDIQHTLGR